MLKNSAWNSPAHVMPLLEIVRTEKTSAQVVLDLMAVGRAIKKVSVVVGNCAGFAVNRTFFPYTQSAHILVNLGVDVFRIDRLIDPSESVFACNNIIEPPFLDQSNDDSKNS